MNTHAASASCAAIRVKPPWILAASFAIGIGLQVLLRSSFTVDPQTQQWLAWAGYAVAALAALLLLDSGRQFTRHETDSNCSAPDSALVTTGFYRFTRNPIYLSFALIFISMSLSHNAPILLPVAALMLLALHRLVVLPEERHLSAVFGEPYFSYCRRIRRWV